MSKTITQGLSNKVKDKLPESQFLVAILEPMGLGHYPYLAKTMLGSSNNIVAFRQEHIISVLWKRDKQDT